MSEPITWRREDTEGWLAAADERERNLAPVLEMLMAAAGLRPGEHVLDVGCGRGPTTSAAAAAVRPGGSVLGLDVDAAMIAAARRLVTAPEVQWLAADATTAPLPEASFDAVISRFGLMFFADPRRAFTQLATATRPGGRLVAAVWPPRTEVEQFMVPYEAAQRVLDRAEVAYEEPSPSGGPFSLGTDESLLPLLRETGWPTVSARHHTLEAPIGLPGVDVAAVAHGMLDRGPAGVLMTDQPAALRAEAERELAAVLAERVTPEGLTLRTRVRMVIAIRG